MPNEFDFDGYNSIADLKRAHFDRKTEAKIEAAPAEKQATLRYALRRAYQFQPLKATAPAEIKRPWVFYSSDVKPITGVSLEHNGQN